MLGLYFVLRLDAKTIARSGADCGERLRTRTDSQNGRRLAPVLMWAVDSVVDITLSGQPERGFGFDPGEQAGTDFHWKVSNQVSANGG